MGNKNETSIHPVDKAAGRWGLPTLAEYRYHGSAKHIKQMRKNGISEEQISRTRAHGPSRNKQ
jgi:hypothetical protein